MVKKSLLAVAAWSAAREAKAITVTTSLACPLSNAWAGTRGLASIKHTGLADPEGTWLANH